MCECVCAKKEAITRFDGYAAALFCMRVENLGCYHFCVTLLCVCVRDGNAQNVDADRDRGRGTQKKAREIFQKTTGPYAVFITAHYTDV